MIFAGQPYRPVMGSILSAVVSLFAFRFRSRASLEIELIAVRHQLAVLRRQRPGRPQLSSLDRLLWMWLYRINGTGQAGNRGPMASQGRTVLLALAIMPSGTT